MGLSNKRRKCCLLSWSRISMDPRVRRLGDALYAAGWDVVGVGLPESGVDLPKWPILTVPGPEPGKIENSGRLAGQLVSASLAPVQTILKAAGSPYAAHVRDIRARTARSLKPISRLANEFSSRAARHRQERDLPERQKLLAKYWRLTPDMRAFEKIATQLDGPALWVANDWWMLPIADAGQRNAGGAIVYDSHELATEEFSELQEWRDFQRPVVAAVEDDLIRKAKVVTSVSPGITRHLGELYKIDAPMLTLLNAPVFQDASLRPAGSEVRVLYHGLIRQGRGLEPLIESLAQWKSMFSLTIRGPSEAGYLADLQAIGRRHGVSERVTFAPPEPARNLVAAARAFDIGVMALPDLSLHTRYALPNKLFEYLMAGLAIVVTDLPEMGKLVRETGAGLTIPKADAAGIAKAINSLDRDQLNRMKQAALETARQLNWEAQVQPVLLAYAAVMDAVEGY